MAIGKIIYDEAAYLKGMQSLLPQGPAWEFEDDAIFKRLMDVCACEFARIDADIARLIEESDPRTAGTTLPDWFDEWGIPDDCLKLLPNATTDDYRNVLILKITTLGLPFFELVQVVANLLGYNCYIGDTNIFTVKSLVNHRIYDDQWRYTALIISVDSTLVKYFRTTSRVSMALAEWGDELWECLISSLAPAHCNLIFQYGSN